MPCIIGKKERPLKSFRNEFQRRKSPFTHVFSRIKCLADLTPLVRSMRRRRKARPGITTEQAKFNSPIKDCSSFNCTFFRVINDETRALHLTILSAGKRACIRTVSSSIPAKLRTLCGPAVFSWAIGTPKLPHRCKNFSRFMRH